MATIPRNLHIPASKPVRSPTDPQKLEAFREFLEATSRAREYGRLQKVPPLKRSLPATRLPTKYRVK